MFLVLERVFMQIYKVGGAVRDKLLEREVVDHDYVVVGATVEEMLAAGYTPVGKDFPVFLHPDTHEEYALARTERKVAKGYHGFEFYTDKEVTLEEDLIRRDLTINAIAEDPVEKILSQTDGLGVDRVIECVGTYVEIAGQEGPVEQAVKMSRAGGRIVVMGLGSQLTPIFWKECVLKELQIAGSRVTMGDYPRAIRLMDLNKFHPDLLVSEVFELKQLDQAFHFLEDEPEKYIKLLVKNE